MANKTSVKKGNATAYDDIVRYAKDDGTTGTKSVKKTKDTNGNTNAGNAGAASDNGAKSTVDSMSARDRLWDSLDYSYGQKAEKVQKQYEQALSQTDNQMLKRGLQRSSQAMQTLANLRQEGADAVADVYSQQIADYENRLSEIEAREQEQENWERTFAQNQQQIDWNQRFQQNQFNYQKQRDLNSDNQWQQSFDYQKIRDSVSDDQWQRSFDYQSKTADQQYAYTQVMQILQAGNTPSSDLLAKAGISLADYKAMLKKQKATGGGRAKNPGNNNPDGDDNPDDNGLNDDLYGLGDNPVAAGANKKAGSSFVPYQNLKLKSVQKAGEYGPTVRKKDMYDEYLRRVSGK